MDLSIIVGNPKPQSRTLAVAEALAARVARMMGATVSRTVDLCTVADDLFKWPNDDLTALADAVASSDVVVASPTYKAAYTGLLKAFLDRYPSNGLSFITAFAVMKDEVVDAWAAGNLTGRHLPRMAPTLVQAAG